MQAQTKTDDNKKNRVLHWLHGWDFRSGFYLAADGAANKKTATTKIAAALAALEMD